MQEPETFRIVSLDPFECAQTLTGVWKQQQLPDICIFLYSHSLLNDKSRIIFSTIVNSNILAPKNYKTLKLSGVFDWVSMSVHRP